MEQLVIAPDGVRLAADVFGSPTSGVPALCVPGLTRNAQDFTQLASRLSANRLVVAVDLRGRGRSGRDPSAQSYTLTTYAADLLHVCDALELRRPVWIGTSLGGLISMQVGATAPDRVAGIVLNDIGPELAPEGLARIRSYAGNQPAVASWSEAVAQVREVSEAQAPDLSDEEWLDQARMRYRELDDGRLVPDYDPAIVSGPPSGEDPWLAFGRLVDLPLLLIRGELSDLLATETVRKMQAVHPAMQAVEVPARGHAPFLDEPVALRAIEAFLEGVDRALQ
jgi:pimeloyl-ACP methyl ester carboxylesterase